MRYLVLVLALVSIGCGPTTRMYRVVLRNATSDPLTIGLTGAVPDRIWSSPEELAINSPQDTDRVWGQIVPPGRTADTTVKGKFYDDDPAFVRVYSNGPRSHLDFSQLLSISRGAPNRVDLRLDPGANVFVVHEDHGILEGLRMDNSMR